MNDILLNLIVLICIALIGSGIFVFVRHKQANNENEISQMAANHSWTLESIHEPLAWGLRLKSAQWVLEALSRSSGREAGPGSTDVAMSTTWFSDTPGSTLLLGARTSKINLGGFGDTLTRQVFQHALGAGAGGLAEIQAGSDTFRKKYMLWAQDPIEAQAIISPALEAALLAWNGQPPIIKRSSSGLTIELRGVRLKKTTEILNLVRLGELFIK